MKHRQMYVRRFRFPVGWLTISLALCLVLLTACGTRAGSTTTGSSGFPSVTASKSATTVTTHAQLRKCGVVHTMRMLVVPADQNLARNVEDCFWQAYQQCQPATLIYEQNGLDTGTISTFTLFSGNGRCEITDEVQHFVVPHPPQPTANTICTGLTKQNDGLHFLSCGNMGNVLVPEAGTQ